MFSMDTISARELALFMDNTNLTAAASRTDWEKLCQESREYGVCSVAIHPAAIADCKELLQGSEVRLTVVTGFPLGQNTLKSKLFETSDALEEGADEIDYVINVGKLKEGNTAYLEEEMKQIVALCRQANATSKVIFENCFLTDEEKITMCAIARSVGPDFVKTSTGFGTGGATLADVALMKREVGDSIKVKAAGGIRTLEDSIAMLNAGAERLGTSKGKAILDELLALQTKAE